MSDCKETHRKIVDPIQQIHLQLCSNRLIACDLDSSRKILEGFEEHDVLNVFKRVFCELGVGLGLDEGFAREEGEDFFGGLDLAGCY